MLISQYFSDRFGFWLDNQASANHITDQNELLGRERLRHTVAPLLSLAKLLRRNPKA